MRITATEEYGLRCLMALVNHTGDHPLTIPDIAQKEGLSLPQVSKIMSILRASGLAESVRGRSGGYVLPRPAHQITLYEVFQALGETLLEPGYCDRRSGVMSTCMHANACSIKGLWEVLQLHMDQFFRGLTLEQLRCGQMWMSRRFPTDRAAESISPEEVERRGKISTETP